MDAPLGAGNGTENEAGKGDDSKSDSKTKAEAKSKPKPKSKPVAAPLFSSPYAMHKPPPVHVGPVDNLIRVTRDLKALLDRESEGIYIKIPDDNLSRICIMLVGAEQTPYAKGLFFFTIEPMYTWNSYSEPKKYPYNPPRVKFYSCYEGYIHENLYTRESGGKVCLSILGTWDGPGWAMTMTFNTIIQCIYQIMDLETSGSYDGFKTRINKKVLAVKIPREVTKYVYEPVLRGEVPSFEVSGEQFSVEPFLDEIRALWQKYESFYRQYGSKASSKASSKTDIKPASNASIPKPAAAPKASVPKPAAAEKFLDELPDDLDI